VIPAVADGDVADFVSQNAVENFRAARIASGGQLGANAGVHVQPPGFEGARHQRHAGQNIASGFFGHVPQAVVGGKVAVFSADPAQVIAQQGEVLGFFGGHANPVAVKIFGQVLKAPNNIEREVDGVELDVRNGVQQGGVTLGVARVAAGHLLRGDQFRLFRAAGEGGVWRCLHTGGRVDAHAPLVQIVAQGQRQLNLVRRVGLDQCGQCGLAR
jgi:hypothetical protein